MKNRKAERPKQARPNVKKNTVLKKQHLQQGKKRHFSIDNDDLWDAEPDDFDPN